MLNFDDYLKQSQSVTVESIQEQVEESQNGGYGDDGFFRVRTDQAGNGTATVRFLPPPPGEKSPFVLYFSHYFEVRGKKYNERSLTTLGAKDPVGEANSALWNSGYESDKDIARSRSRRKNYVFNVLVVDDPAEPKNNGKILKYRMGPKLFEKIMGAMKPAFAGDPVINPFDLMATGANFRIRVKKVKGYPNYDDSSFGAQGPLFGGDIEKMRAVFSNQEIPSLQAELDPSKFKTFEQLKERFNEVVNGGEANETGRAEDLAKSDAAPQPAGWSTPAETSPPPRESAPVLTQPTPAPAESADADLEFFRNLGKKAS